MPRRSTDAADPTPQAERYQDRGHPPRSAAPAALGSPTKQRIAEALAALLVAHYRRHQDSPGSSRERLLGT
jgi:hypothetical protein